ncbi:ABC transporter substrate-binding protein [Deinococcus roseus]|uniref:Sugar-binding protein n=1 Tax=Deinococcus roseus TaxID=392414 RepID=A0ABQ2D2T1_9DEIO|nr:sugar ABC transporter substrate-binding protein [Deinococcus roseus]GGJ43460.1 sugar-binding protein [Deinococcus roseus]
MNRTLLSALLFLGFSVSAYAEPVTINMWRHETGDDEVNANKAAIERFNASQSKYKVVYESLPKGSYTQAITAAALANNLPCIFDMDQPTVPNFAWSGYIRPLDAYLDARLKKTINAGGKGEFRGKLYSVGQFDVALGIFARKSALSKAGIRIPSAAKPWTLEEFNAALSTLKASGDWEYPIEIHNGYDGEWWTYAFSPWLQSFGGDLLNPKDLTEAEGTLNGPAAVKFGQWFQGLFAKGYANKKPADDQAFLLGRVPLDYTGSWAFSDFSKKWGSDLVVLPPPNFGKGPKIGAASWQWGISTSCKNPEGAAAYINFMMSPKEVATMSDKTSLIPTTTGAAPLTKDYNSKGKARFYYEFSKRFAVSRPATPGYPFVTSTFEKAMRAIVQGANVQDTLDDAVDLIERNIKDNKGYGLN